MFQEQLARLVHRNGLITNRSFSRRVCLFFFKLLQTIIIISSSVYIQQIKSLTRVRLFFRGRWREKGNKIKIYSNN